MITTVTLNTSIDKAYYMEKEIVNGQVMRVSRCKNSAGGKGLNVTRVISLCDEEVLATGLVGGYNGEYLESLLRYDGIDYDFTHIQEETRCCINILDPKYGSTEYLEPGRTVTKKEESEFINHFNNILDKSEVITLSGSIPSGMSTSIYKSLIEMAKSKDKLVLLDTSGDCLKEGIEALPTLVKPNKDEIEMLFDIKINSLKDMIKYAKMISNKGIEYVVVSLGGEGALLVTQDKVLHGLPPKINPVNTVGCGDSMVAAFAVALKRNYELTKALTYAIAIATANALSSDTGHYYQEDFNKIINEVKVNEL